MAQPQTVRDLFEYDAFLTHDWGQDELGRDNHQRVVKIAEMLRQTGIRTWIDEERLSGDIAYEMSRGIDASVCTIVFITQRYGQKVSAEGEDFCKKEFQYACKRKTVDFMIPVVMEPRMLNQQDWEGKLGFNLSGHLFIDMSSDDLGANLDKLVQAVFARIRKRQEAADRDQRPSISSGGSGGGSSTENIASSQGSTLADTLAQRLLELSIFDDAAPILEDMGVRDEDDLSLAVKKGFISHDTLTRKGVRPVPAAKLLSRYEEQEERRQSAGAAPDLSRTSSVASMHSNGPAPMFQHHNSFHGQMPPNLHYQQQPQFAGQPPPAGFVAAPFPPQQMQYQPPVSQAPPPQQRVVMQDGGDGSLSSFLNSSSKSSNSSSSSVAPAQSVIPQAQAPRDINVVIRSIAQNTCGPQLNLSWRNLEDEHVTAIAEAMKTNLCIHTLDLSHNKLGTHGLSKLASVLKSNQTLRVLNVGANRLEEDAGLALAYMLHENKHLEELNLYENLLGPRAGVALAEALLKNNSLKSLGLFNNKLTDKGGKAFVKVLGKNVHLTALRLTNNKLGAGTKKALNKAKPTHLSLFA